MILPITMTIVFQELVFQGLYKNVVKSDFLFT